jgi:hypothetical protein
MREHVQSMSNPHECDDREDPNFNETHEQWEADVDNSRDHSIPGYIEQRLPW